jgi:hypothetical protein
VRPLLRADADQRLVAGDAAISDLQQQENGIACKAVGGRWFNNQMVEDAILDNVAEYKLSELFADPHVDEKLKAIEGALAAQAEKISELQKEQSNLVRAIGKLDDDDPTREDYHIVLREQRAEIDAAKVRTESLQQQRADLLLQQDQRRDVDGEIRRLRDELATLDPEVEADQRKMVMIRAKLASALRTFISHILFDCDGGTIRLFVGHGLVSYTFKRSPRRHGPKKDFSITLVGRNNDMAMGHTFPRGFFPIDDEVFDKIVGAQQLDDEGIDTNGWNGWKRPSAEIITVAIDMEAA